MVSNCFNLELISSIDKGGLSTLKADNSNAAGLFVIWEARFSKLIWPLWIGLNEPDRITPEKLLSEEFGVSPKYSIDSICLEVSADR